MSTPKPENPPAFPRPDLETETVRSCPAQDGMTLRDYFAGQALVGYMASFGPDQAIPVIPTADFAYELAAAMLAKRVEESK